MFLVLALSSICFPVLSLPFVVADFAKRRNVIFSAALFSLIMSVLAMGLVNSDGGDLTTYSNEVLQYEGAHLSELNNFKYADYPIASFVFWVIGQTGNPHLIQGACACIEYYIISYIVLRFLNDNKANGAVICFAIASILAFVPLYNSVSALRSTISLSIGVLALFRDVYEKKRNLFTMLLYFCPIFIHAVGLTMLGIRLLLIMSNKVHVNCFFLGFAVLPVVLAGSSILSGLFAIFAINPIDILTSYVNQSESGWSATVANSMFYQLYRILNIVVAIAFSWMLLQLSRRMDSKAEKNLCAVLLACLGLIVGFCFFFTDPAFMRYSYTAYPLVMMILVKHYLETSQLARTSLSLSLKPYEKRNEIVILCLSSTIVIFLICQGYLFLQGAELLPLIKTALFGLFGSPWIGGM